MEKKVYEQFLNKKYKVRPIENIRDIVLSSARIFGRKTAFFIKRSKDSYESISYSRLKSDYLSLAAAFLSMGLRNKAVAVTGANSYEWAVAYLAACTVGTVVPLDKELPAEDMVNFINISETAAVVGDEKIIENIKTHGGFHPAIAFVATRSGKETETVRSLIKKGAQLYAQGKTEAEYIPIPPDETRILIFTSGTTGKAKGVCLSHRNICSNIQSVSKMVKVRSSDRVLSILPLHHTYECTIGFLDVLYNGACITYCDGLRYIYKNIGEYHPSIIVTVPLLLEKISQKMEDAVREKLPERLKEKTKGMGFTELLENLPFYVRGVIKRKVKNSLGGRMHTFIVGAAGIDKNIIEQFGMMGVRVLQGYGLTECAPLLVGNNDFFMKSDSAGLPIHDVELRIYNPDAEGIGEIIARGPNIMKGYYKDKEATDAVIKDGWFHTGDLGYIDSNGFVYITGRRKNVIVTKNGKNIYPEEIENHLYGNRLVADAIVIGAMNDNDDVFVKAKILPNLEAIKETLKVSVPTKEEVYELMKKVVAEINEKLPSYKRIKGFIVREKEFEKTTTQKIKRFGDNIRDEK